MPTTWCDQSDVEAILSQHGVIAFADDDEDRAADTGIVDATIERAAYIEIHPLVASRYRLADITSNTFLKWANATFAAMYLSERRNLAAPSTVVDHANHLREILRMVFAGKRDLPEQAESFDYLPSVTNFNIQRRRRTMPVRVVQEESTRSNPPDGVERRYAHDGKWR